MAFACVFSLRVDQAAPLFWYWVECDDEGRSTGEPSTPYGSKQAAEASARAHGFTVVPYRD